VGAAATRPSAEPLVKPEINVILWFDTEDYLLLADDDAAKRLAEMLSERNIRATFKLVGEKARVLEKRGRSDVINALKKHDIGYHANLHSVHPTPSEYLAECGLLDGISEFVRREGGGAADVRRVFAVDTLSCYGQPGSSWGPQAIAALPQIGVAPRGIPCYLDEGAHVGLNAKPFWYAGALNVYHMGPNYTRMELHDPAAVEPGKKKFTAIAQRLGSYDGGGLISIFYHPCEWVHQEFWDGVNFRRGANPPREEWKPPPQRPAAETEAAFRRFAEYIDHIRSTPGVRFVTASDLPGLYPDSVRGPGCTEEDLEQIATRLLRPDATGVDFVILGQRSYSVADQFNLLTLAVSQLIIEGGKVRFPLAAESLLGPDRPPPSHRSNLRLGWAAFRDATLDVRDFLQKERRVPARVFIGSDAIPPADFLAGLAFTLHYYNEKHELPLGHNIPTGTKTEMMAARYIAQDSPELFGGWVIHRENFRAPNILEVARLQAWTLKPAMPARFAQVQK